MATLFFEKMSPSHRSLRATGKHGAGLVSSGTETEYSLPINMIIMTSNIPLNATEKLALETTHKSRELYNKAVDINTRINNNIESKNYARARELLNDNTDEVGNLQAIKVELTTLTYKINVEEAADHATKVNNMFTNADTAIKVATGETKLAEGKPAELADVKLNAAAKKPVVAHLEIKIMDKNDYHLYFTDLKAFEDVYSKL